MTININRFIRSASLVVGRQDAPPPLALGSPIDEGSGEEVVVLLIDPVSIINQGSTSYNDTVVVGQGDALLRPILNSGSTQYNETILVAQGESLLRPILNQGSTSYNDTVVVP